MLNLLIRSHYKTIADLKHSATKFANDLPSHLRGRILPIAKSAGEESKATKKAECIKKLHWIKSHNHRTGKADTNHQNEITDTDHQDEQPMSTDKPMITILTTEPLNDDAVSALSRGPKFAITPKITPDVLQRTVQTEVAALAYTLRWRAAITKSTLTPVETANEKSSENGDTNTNNNGNQNPTCVKMPHIPFHKGRKAPPRGNDDLERTLKNVQVEFENLVKRTHLPKPNLTGREYKAVKELRNHPELTIVRSDKGGELVVMNTTQLHDLTTDHLSDETTYKKLPKNPTEAMRMEINQTLKNILIARGYPRNFYEKFMTPETAKTQRFYTLPKTHKKTLKIRPIVSGKGGIFDRIGWFLQNLLKPLLTNVAAHINNTQQLIDRLDSVPIEQLTGKIPISFDVRALYTNINIDEAILTTLEYAQKYDLECYSLELDDIKTLLELVLKNNIFRYGNQMYQQVQGLAMGGRVSGSLAILVMDRFERNYIYNQLAPTSTIYVRYIDDTNTVANNADEALQMLEYLNSKHNTIKFDLETPDTSGYLPILDLKICITKSGQISRKHYKKDANRGLTLQYESHHASTVKKAIVSGEFARAIAYSTPDHRDEALKMAENKLQRNGYPQRWIKRESQRQQRNRDTTSSTKTKTKKKFDSVLHLPFITDSFNARAQSILQRNGLDTIRIINPRPMTMEQFTSKRQPQEKCSFRKCPIEQSNITHCTRANVVYEARCGLCPATYIGATTRAFHTRAREHLGNIRRREIEKSALAEHFVKHHDAAVDNPIVTFRTLATAKNELRLWIQEAYWIQRLKPSLNRKGENMGTGFLA